MAKRKSKSKAAVSKAMREVFNNPPSTAEAKGKAARRKQLVAIGLSKARRAGARVPKKRKR
jgi:hypothetical protein